MVRCLRHFVWVWLLLLVAGTVGCACASGPDITDTTTTTSETTTSTTTDEYPCGIDCAGLATAQCTVAVCNLGQVVGPLNTCVVIPLENGSTCDDGQFCTTGDKCEGGTCVGGSPSTCGMKSSPCVSVVCYEESKSCDGTPVNDGAECTPTNLCEVSGICSLGECLGEPKDCAFSPLSECNTVACDPATGMCSGFPDATKDDAPCFLTGDICKVNKTCKSGQCGGGSTKDCSALDAGCEVGVCDPANGSCNALPAPIGTSCSEGLSECDVGACDDKGSCIASSAPNGDACNDHNSCTQMDKCQAGACSGVAVSGCELYIREGFEVCPNGWTFGGDWECGTPENVGPPDANTGKGVIATQIAGLYHVGQSFGATVADSPPIDLTLATNPVVSFWAWVHTEGGTFDGWNLKISTNGGQSFATITTVSPPYNLTMVGQPAWGGNLSANGWQNYSADLTAFKGQQVILRFAFRSDGATVFPGVYIDDLVVAEPLQNPLFITTSSPLMDVYSGMAVSIPLTRTGGTGNAVWSITGGTNKDWLTIDPATGVLTGTPGPANLGAVTVNVHIEEPMLPSNFADKTLTFNVNQALYYTSFEGACPSGWTLAGDWECGVPTMVGPASAFVGSQCLATKIGALYSDLQTWAATTATSPDINLIAAIGPKLTFRMWVDTEGTTYDGFNLQASADGGMNYTILTGTPAYPLMIAGKPAWGGHQAALGWQLVEVDLSPYAGQFVRLQFSFQSDSSGTFPGVYIDDILVN